MNDRFKARSLIGTIFACALLVFGTWFANSRRQGKSDSGGELSRRAAGSTPGVEADEPLRWAESNHQQRLSLGTPADTDAIEDVLRSEPSSGRGGEVGGRGTLLDATEEKPFGVPGTPEEQRRWVLENRDLYFEADKELIQADLARFHLALAEGDHRGANDHAWSLMASAIAVTLAKQGRETFNEPGSKYTLLPSSDEQPFVRGNWRYVAHRAEFPEYFDLIDTMNEFDTPGAEFQPMSSALIQAIEAHANRAQNLLQ